MSTTPTPTLELVRCGCGLVRNDEDKPAWLLQGMAVQTFAGRGYELPRVCRGCGCIYALPKQQPPSSSSST